MKYELWEASDNSAEIQNGFSLEWDDDTLVDIFSKYSLMIFLYHSQRNIIKLEFSKLFIYAIVMIGG